MLPREAPGENVSGEGYVGGGGAGGCPRRENISGGERLQRLRFPYGFPALPGHPQLVEASLLLCPSVCLSFCDEDPISLTRDPPHDSLASVN